MKKIASIILCAGAASRMGKIKALLPWREKSLIAHAVNAARGASITEIIIVLGAHAEEIAPEASTLKVETVINDSWANGIGSSIKLGVTQARARFGEPEALLIQLADQPLIDGSCVARLMQAYALNKNHITAAEYNELPGVPALFPKLFFQDLSMTADHHGAKQLMLANRDKLTVVKMPEGAQDIDTPEQYRNL